METLRNRLAELEGRDSSRDAVVALETKVDELEQVGCLFDLFGWVIFSFLLVWPGKREFGI